MKRAHKPAQPQQRPSRQEVWHPASFRPSLSGAFWTERIKGGEKAVAFFDTGTGVWTDVLDRPAQVNAWASDVLDPEGEPFAYDASKKARVKGKSYSSIARQLGVNIYTFRVWVLRHGCPFSFDGAVQWIAEHRK